MTIEVNIETIKHNNVNSLLALLNKDDEIIIKNSDKVLAKLINQANTDTAASAQQKERPLGAFKGQIQILDGFYECDKEIEEEFLNSKIFHDE
ncbi:MAG TPA: hypothetical protein DIV86_06065 [Alphaproteobacteria bacterium]|nr:hypothetical protein [Alphaproteobacteria bacterium]